MSDPKGDFLYVNLSAAKTKLRLAGFGHGVRKIHSAGKNQTAIIHTASGRHLEELRAQFADVGFSDREDELSPPIENLRNLGESSGRWLREIGILTMADLEKIGAVVAFQMVKRRQQSVSLNLLWAMAAGLQDRDWRELTDGEKETLHRSLGQ